ncbi:MAG: site-2 protease family protein [Anaerolineales bacterium]|nr:site-2 protease family protein [Anaerolineales bacterium]
MSAILALLQFIVAIAALIVVHELGHYLAAKLCGIKVQEFGIGFPPRLVRLFKIQETEFTLNAIPLGGFAMPAGENDPDVPGGFSAASPWKRIFIFVAGPAMNLLAAALLYAIIFMQLGQPDTSIVQVMWVSDDSPAQQAGLQTGDVLTHVNGQAISSTQDIRDAIYANLGEEILIEYQRDGQRDRVTLVPRDPAPADGAIGISMGHPSVPVGLGAALVQGGRAIYDQAEMLLTLPGRIASGEMDSSQGRFVGYKGMYDIYTEVREADAAPDSPFPSGVNTLSFFASISVSLGLLNLMPIPALDGGRILFTLPELLFGKRIPMVYQNAVNFIGLAFLLMAMVYINLQDFLNPLVLP